MENPILRIRNLHRSFQGRKVLEGITFDVMPGTFTTLLGVNGAGKSTLLRLIAGCDSPDAGDATFKEVCAHHWQLPHKHEMFYIHENISIETTLTAGEFAKHFSVAFPNWHEEFFRQMVRERGLDLDAHYSQYSRGQRVQYNLMLGLAARPQVLLLDEVTSVLDVYARRYFLGHLHRFCQAGRTVLMTTNIISELEYYTSHLLLLQKGQLKLAGPIGEVKREFVKLRFPEGEAHPLRECPDLCWSGLNHDGSENFLLARDVADRMEIDPRLVDRRAITLEDIFIFYYADRKEGAHARAA